MNAFKLRGKWLLPSVLLLMPLLASGIPPDAPRVDSALELIVRPTDIDVKGHVNNARHVEYLQWGRWQWLDERGFSIDAQQQAGCVLVVVNLNLNYRKECLRGDKLTVLTRTESVGEKSFALHQEIRKQDGTTALDGVVTLVAIDPVTRKSRQLPEQLKRALAE
jgi:thioesterase-3